MRGAAGRDVLRQEEQNEAHAVHDHAEVLQEGREGLGPQVGDDEADAELDETEASAQAEQSIVHDHDDEGGGDGEQAQRRDTDEHPNGEMDREAVLGILQLTEDDAQNGEDDLRDQTAHLQIGTDGHGLQEVRHNHHGTDVGTVQRNQGADVVQPVAARTQSLVHQLSVRVVGLDRLVVVLPVKHRHNACRMVLVDLSVQLHQLIGGENHHAANQHEQENARNDTHLHLMSFTLDNLIKGERKSQRARTRNTLHEIDAELWNTVESHPTSRVFIFPFSSSSNSEGIVTLLGSSVVSGC